MGPCYTWAFLFPSISCLMKERGWTLKSPYSKKARFSNERRAFCVTEACSCKAYKELIHRASLRTKKAPSETEGGFQHIQLNKIT
jgi:hypothetical protein